MNQIRQPSAAQTTEAADPARLAADLAALVDALEPVLEQETRLVRAGRMADAASLQTRKAELAASYVTLSRRLRADADRLPAPARAALARDRQRHDRLRDLLQTNLMVVATAHAVTEGLIRGAAEEVARRATPQTYGAAGRAAAPSPRSTQPVALNRQY